MRVIMQTIQILNMKNKEAIDVAVHNVRLPGGEAGCEVTFCYPISMIINMIYNLVFCTDSTEY